VTEILRTYSAAHATVPADSAEAWYVIGAFFLPKAAPATRLDAMVCVSSADAQARVRLFDLTAKAPVVGSVAISRNTVSERIRSGILALAGSRSYQIQARCLGVADPDSFAVIKTATITD
jgi:hypothetical protein